MKSAPEKLTPVDTVRATVDLIARTPEQIEERIALNDGFIREIMEKGRVLYDSAHAGVGG